MNIVISGKHLRVGESLRTHTAQFLEKHIRKYFACAINAHVIISRVVDAFHTHITVNDGTASHLLINGDGDDKDAYKSVDKAIKKIAKQLEKYKNRIKYHKRSKDAEASIEAISYIINDFEDEAGNVEPQAAPTIVAEQQSRIEIMSVRDAVMHMDLQNIPAMLFVNATTNKVNMIYYRGDKNIAWIDTSVVVSR